VAVQRAAHAVGRVYYPVEILPRFFQWVAHGLPVTYALRAMRLALLQGLHLRRWRPIWAVLAAFAVVLVP